jgi:arylsulfatase A-like enzyme
MTHLRRIVALAAMASGVIAPTAFPAEPGRRTNIVFILADDLGWTDLGCQGSTFYETPNIDRLAAGGMRFVNGYSCGPNCQPTRAALMTGQYGPRTGVYTVGSIERFNWRSRPLRPVANVESLPLEKTTVAEALKAAGYATGMFGKWHLGGANFHPSRQGFDEAIVSMGRHFNFATQPAVEVPRDAYLADFLTDKALAFLEMNRDRPFFLYLPHFAVHSPFEAKKELIEKFQKKAGASGSHRNATYAAMIASLDESVGRVLAKLDELKLAEHTLVIFSSDNGGVGGYVREGLKAVGDVTDNAPLRGGKGMLYEGGIRVPWIFRRPGTIAAGTVCEEPILSVDLFPTLLAVAGVESTPTGPLDGVSVVPCLTSAGKAATGRDAIYWHFPGYLGAGANTWRTTPAGAIRAGDFKLHEFFEDGRLELYNLREDICERTNLAAKMPERTKDLHARLVAWRKAVNAPMPTPITEKDKAETPKAEKTKKKQEKP